MIAILARDLLILGCVGLAGAAVLIADLLARWRSHRAEQEIRNTALRAILRCRQHCGIDTIEDED